MKHVIDLTDETLLSFTGWDDEDLTMLKEAHGWDNDSIRNGITYGLKQPKDFVGLDLWDKTYLLRGHLWGDQPSETALLAAMAIPDDGGALLDLGFGYGRDTVWMAQRRRNVMGIEKSKIGMTALMNALGNNERNVSVIYASMKNHRFDPGSLSGIFSHRVLHLPHPEKALPDIINNMADAVKVGGTIVVSARSVHDFYQDKEGMHDVILDDHGFPISAEYKERPGHKVNYFTENRFSQLFGHVCSIKELYLGREPESKDNVNEEGEQVYSYYMSAVMKVLPAGERTLSFGPTNGVRELPQIKLLPSLQSGEEIIQCTPLSREELDAPQQQALLSAPEVN